MSNIPLEHEVKDDGDLQQRNSASLENERQVSTKLFVSKSSKIDSSSPSKVLKGCRGCFAILFGLLCPCVHKEEKKDKDLPLREITSNSLSNSIGESSLGASASASSTAYSTSSQLDAQKLKGGRTFTLAELNKATGKFSPAFKIGQGGFGMVYKGKLKDGTVVAIKRAKKKALDERLSAEFENEVDMLLKVDHLNLVKMIGYLEEDGERILVEEYVPNGNLREHLDCTHGVVLDLAIRLDIAIDVAHALTYLHLYADNPIIHRDVKSSNILLTENFRAKVADFGYSRIGPVVHGATHVSTQVKGTAGYLDPEYLKTYKLTEKSDVYSFGVVLVEIITGRRPIEQKREMKERVTVRWAFKKFLDGKIIEILDPRLQKTSAASVVVERISELAFQCTAPTKQDRPNMKRVVEVLWEIRNDHRNLVRELKVKNPSSTDSDSNGVKKSAQELKLKNSNSLDTDRKGSKRLSTGSN